jgi:hypothetical protein
MRLTDNTTTIPTYSRVVQELVVHDVVVTEKTTKAR